MRVSMQVRLDTEAIQNVPLEDWEARLLVPIEDYVDVYVAVAAAHMLGEGYEPYVKGSQHWFGLRWWPKLMALSKYSTL
jgi:hypothetical protein